MTVSDATRGTRLSAVFDATTHAVRLYYQDTDLAFREILWKSHGRETLQSRMIQNQLKYKALISAICWGSLQPDPEIRIFTVTQANRGNISQLRYTSRRSTQAMSLEVPYRKLSGIALCGTAGYLVTFHSPICLFYHWTNREICMALVPADYEFTSKLMMSNILPPAGIPTSIDGPLQGSQEDTAAQGASQTGQRWTTRFVLQGDRYVSFSSDSKLLISKAEHGSARLWDTDTGIARLIFVGGIGGCAFSRTDPLIAVRGLLDPIAVRDTATGIARHEFTHDGGMVTGLDFSPDGRLLASGSWSNTDGIVRVWNIAKGTLYFTLNTSDEQVWMVKFSPDGKLIATYSGQPGGKHMRLWSSATGQMQYVYAVDNNRNDFAFSSDSSLFAISSRTWIRVVHIPTRVEREIRPEVPAVCFKFALGSYELAVAHEDNTVKMYDGETGLERRTLAGDGDKVITMAFSSDRKLLATGSLDTTIILWDLVTGKEHCTLTGHQAAVVEVQFAPNTTLLASTSVDKTVRLWESALFK